MVSYDDMCIVCRCYMLVLHVGVVRCVVYYCDLFVMCYIDRMVMCAMLL